MSHLLLLMMTSGIVCAQAPPPVTKRDPAEWGKIRTSMRSREWQERQKAFHAIAGLGCADPDAAGAGFQLLGIENAFIDDHVSRRTSPDEGWSDPYYSSLLGFTFSCFRHSPRPDWFRLLALGSYNPDSPYAKDLAKYVDGNLPWLLAAAPAPSNPYTRANLYPLLVNALAYNPAWSAKDRSAVLATVERGLSDADDYVVISTAWALAYSKLPAARNMLSEAKSNLLGQSKDRSIAVQGLERTIAKADEAAKQ